MNVANYLLMLVICSMSAAQTGNTRTELTELQKSELIRRSVMYSNLIGERVKKDDWFVYPRRNGMVSLKGVKVNCIFQFPIGNLSLICNSKLEQDRMDNGPKPGKKYTTDADWYKAGDEWVQKLWPGTKAMHDRVQYYGYKPSSTGYWSNAHTIAITMWTRVSKTDIRMVSVGMDAATAQLISAQNSEPFPISTAKRMYPDSRYLQSLK